MRTLFINFGFGLLIALNVASGVAGGEEWLQYKFDSRHSGNVVERTVATPLGLVGAVPLTDAVYTSPVITDGRVYVVDGAGVAFCIDVETMHVVWKRETRGGRANSNNVSSPAIVGKYLHFGTMAGSYYVLERTSGKVVTEIRCGEPVFSAPVVGRTSNPTDEPRVYFATLGSQVYALDPDGTVHWKWDYVTERLGFKGDRWSGEEWAKFKQGQVTWDDQFCCARNIGLYDNTVVLPAGGTTVFLEDAGDSPRVRGVGVIGDVYGRETPAIFGQTINETGAVYQQFHRRDNTGRVEILRLQGDTVATDFVPGTRTSPRGADLLGFSAVSVRGRDVYRCRPQDGFGLCRHSLDDERRDGLRKPPSLQATSLAAAASISSPILLRDSAVYGGLDSRLYVAPLDGQGKAWSFKTAFGKAITAPAAVCDGRIFFGCEDGYLYVLAPDGKAPLPTEDLELWKIRSPLTGKFTDARFDWFTNYGDMASSNVNRQGVTPPFKLRWIRRYSGTTKHFSTCGAGRMYTHTAEGQVFAVEQETGRLLWRRYWPGVHISYTAPLYYKERILVPQAGIEQGYLRCLDAATGELLWQAPFTGSPGWNRQQPPVVLGNLVIYCFGSGKYGPGKEKRWFWGDRSSFYKDEKPLVGAWDLDTGKEVWTVDFSKRGAGGNDAGLCLMDGTLYYSCYFGFSSVEKRRGGKVGVGDVRGVTAAINPQTGEVLWTTTRHFNRFGCTISGSDGRLYLGGYGKLADGNARVWCLDAKDGSLIWESEPVPLAIHVVTIGERFLFVHAQKFRGYLLDKKTGRIITTLAENYKCTRFTLSEPYLIGTNMDLHDLSDPRNIKLISTGPPLDVLQCSGAMVSNGRIFYSTNGSGLQTSMACGSEAASFIAPWERP